jgi:hypothetical protein
MLSELTEAGFRSQRFHRAAGSRRRIFFTGHDATCKSTGANQNFLSFGTQLSGYRLALKYQ